MEDIKMLSPGLKTRACLPLQNSYIIADKEEIDSNKIQLSII